MVDAKPFSLGKPTLDTPFHIDFSWWSQNDREYRVHLRGMLSEEDIERFDSMDSDAMVDWVDPITAEVSQIDGLQHFLISEVSQQEGFLNPHTALTEAIFRVLLVHGNTPMSVNEIAEKLDRDPKNILRTLSGVRVYRGIRPILDL